MGVVFKNVCYDNLSNRIINNLSLLIKSNKITFIIGESGSGKSTLLSLINGDIEATDGEIDKDCDKISFLRQNPEDYFFCNTVYEEMWFALKKAKVKNLEKKIIESLEIVDLGEDCLYKSPFEISKGEQKRLAIAIALAINSKLLLLDDPFSNLDYASRKKMIKLFRMMKLRYGKTIIIACNDTDRALELADDIICIKKGNLMFNGNKFDLFTNTDLIKKCNIAIPKLINFTNLVKFNKGINIGYRDDINDLMKDVYRFVK